MARARRRRRTKGGLGVLTQPAPPTPRAQSRAQHGAVAAQHEDRKAGTLALHYEQLGHGRGVRITSPDLPGWATLARTPADFAKIVDAGVARAGVLGVRRPPWGGVRPRPPRRARPTTAGRGAALPIP